MSDDTGQAEPKWEIKSPTEQGRLLAAIHDLTEAVRTLSGHLERQNHPMADVEWGKWHFSKKMDPTDFSDRPESRH